MNLHDKDTAVLYVTRSTRQVIANSMLMLDITHDALESQQY
jgi:hypothetical protein